MDKTAINREIRRATEQLKRQATHKQAAKPASATVPKRGSKNNAQLAAEKATIEAHLQRNKESMQKAVATLMAVVTSDCGSAPDQVDTGDLEGELARVIQNARQAFD
jgi:hypothetical protein